MNCVQLIFSPTGGTMRAAKAITDPWGPGVETIDLTDPALADRAFQKEDLVLIAVPSFGGRVPELAAQRLTKMRGNSARCVLCCVYGNRAYEDTLVEMQDIAEKQGFRVFAAVAAIAEHSIMHQYAAGRPDTKDIETLRNFSRTSGRDSTTARRDHPQPSQVTAPTKRRAGQGWSPRPERNVSGAERAPPNVRPRRSVGMTRKKRTERNVFLEMYCVKGGFTIQIHIG